MVHSNETTEFFAPPLESLAASVAPYAFRSVEPALLASTRRAGYNSPVLGASQTMRVKVLFFGRLKDIVGRAEDCVELATGAPIEQLFAHYGGRYPELARFRASLVASRNQEFAPWSTPLRAGDEVAFLPPVSGG
jgi:molybdopterin synthase sulfur carrier subunit